jgi:hypothetical protein
LILYVNLYEEDQYVDEKMMLRGWLEQYGLERRKIERYGRAWRRHMSEGKL